LRLLQVRVSLGTRVVQQVEEGEPRALFVIEADYLVEYEMTDDVPDDALKAFAEFNAIHNVWPFWRQHVFGVVDRGRLPRLEVPLFEGVVL
jgi:preprotein translocase subunit SecB